MNKAFDIIAKSGVHESGIEDLVLAEDDKEEPNRDAEQGNRDCIDIALLRKCRRAVIELGQEFSPAAFCTQIRFTREDKVTSLG